MVRITRIFRFEAAHVLSNHQGACRHIHGHSYELHVTVAAERLDEYSMVMDFSELKALVQGAVLDEFDHALIVRRGYPLEPVLSQFGHKVVITEDEPSIEVLLGVFAARIEGALGEKARLARLKLSETKASYAEWEPHPNP